MVVLLKLMVIGYILNYFFNILGVVMMIDDYVLYINYCFYCIYWLIFDKGVILELFFYKMGVGVVFLVG